MNRRRKVDHNQVEIALALRKAGYHVTDLSAVGGGVPDLLLTKAGYAYLIEIKNPKGRNSFTPYQIKYYAEVHCPVFILRSIDDVTRFIKGDIRPINHPRAPVNGRKNPQKASTLDG